MKKTTTTVDFTQTGRKRSSLIFKQVSDDRRVKRIHKNRTLKWIMKYVGEKSLWGWQIKDHMCYGSISSLTMVTFLAEAEDFPYRTDCVPKVQRRGRAECPSNLDKWKQQWKVLAGPCQQGAESVFGNQKIAGTAFSIMKQHLQQANLVLG